MKWLRRVLVALCFFSIVSAAVPLFLGDIQFHTDIARDFLLIEDIVKNKPLTLIGPRSGGIPGVFHGPLWLYLNVPAYVLSQGNPIGVGWFWFMLFLLSIAFLYLIAKKLFGKDAALIGVTVYTSSTAVSIPNFFNPFGAVLLAPLFFYLFYRYLESFRAVLLLAAFFVLGLIIQFQMAFGVPILLLAVPYLLLTLTKRKKLIHLLTLGILLLPLSTHILFEVRHDFLQIRSVFAYLVSVKAHGQQIFSVYLLSRLRGMFVDGLSLTAIPHLLSGLIVSGFLLFGIWKSIGGAHKKKKIYLLFTYFYFGFWILSFLFRGVIWNYYYWPFVPLTALIFASLVDLKKYRPIFYLILALIMTLNIVFMAQSLVRLKREHSFYDGLWRFQRVMAEEIYMDAPSEFGYFIFTPDQFGYSTRYAMNYLQDKDTGKTAYPFTKKETTYLIIAPPPSDRPYLTGDWWKENQVKIGKKPLRVKTYPNGFVVEKYILSEEERAVESDPNLIQDLIFR